MTETAGAGGRRAIVHARDFHEVRPQFERLARPVGVRGQSSMSSRIFDGMASMVTPERYALHSEGVEKMWWIVSRTHLE